MPAQIGDTVNIHFTGTLDDGKVFDSTRDQDPFQFTLGQKQIFPEIEEAVMAMEQGDTKDVSIAPENGFGAYRDDLVSKVARNVIPADIEVKKGIRLKVQNGDENEFAVTVTDLDDESVTLDANHPLAGQRLNFQIELVP